MGAVGDCRQAKRERADHCLDDFHCSFSLGDECGAGRNVARQSAGRLAPDVFKVVLPEPPKHWPEHAETWLGGQRDAGEAETGVNGYNCQMRILMSEMTFWYIKERREAAHS
jgi:hypothetical protein